MRHSKVYFIYIVVGFTYSEIYEFIHLEFYKRHIFQGVIDEMCLPSSIIRVVTA